MGRSGRRSGGDGRCLGDRGRIRCRLGLGSRGRAGLGVPTVSSDGAARAPGPPARPGGRDAPRQARRPDSRQCAVGALPPVGLESPADLIDAAGQVDVQAVEVVAGSVAHLDSVLGPRSIGCSPPEPACRGQTTKTHFQEDVRFACDCDIAFADLGVRGSESVHRFSELQRDASTAIRRKSYPRPVLSDGRRIRPRERTAQIGSRIGSSVGCENCRESGWGWQNPVCDGHRLDVAVTRGRGRAPAMPGAGSVR